MDKMTPVKAQEIMKKHGQQITLTQAQEVLKFMRMLASFEVKKYLASKKR